MRLLLFLFMVFGQFGNKFDKVSANDFLDFIKKSNGNTPQLKLMNATVNYCDAVKKYVSEEISKSESEALNNYFLKIKAELDSYNNVLNNKVLNDNEKLKVLNLNYLSFTTKVSDFFMLGVRDAKSSPYTFSNCKSMKDVCYKFLITNKHDDDPKEIEFFEYPSSVKLFINKAKGADSFTKTLLGVHDVCLNIKRHIQRETIFNPDQKVSLDYLWGSFINNCNEAIGNRETSPYKALEKWNSAKDDLKTIYGFLNNIAPKESHYKKKTLDTYMIEMFSNISIAEMNKVKP